MIDTVLHTGSQHPNLVWVLLPSLLSFAAGLGIGAASGRLRNVFDHNRTASND
ncbi:hypothetical protein [Natrialba asiatica]|uniref:Uncharacterized protein n=2 Tax=Natrialba TaxID=63742 RepID=M0B3Y0_NATA1|nr:hypothetical protein [Natrialba asiatica]ELY92274.1 hypothetical protein C484_09816 [Natrialba taiwanensis DSM 12281]ELZ05490.1 hypothetical protein C481_02187 [Natrialba asiatica DSM 12278]